VIVVDASAVLSALLREGPARRALAQESLNAPHLIDPEVAQGLRRMVTGRELSAEAGWTALDALGRLGVKRFPVHPLLRRVWDLRDNVPAYDASYVALAEALGCNLLTADSRLSRAHGVRCPITVVPG